MGKYTLACLIIFALQLSSLLNTLACPYCTYPTPISSPPPPPPNSPPPCAPQPPKAPVVTPSPPKAPVVKAPPPPSVPKPPKAPAHPHMSPPPPPHQKPPPPPSSPVVKKSPPPPQYCPIDTLKLHTCVDLLGGLVHIGIGQRAQDACCPVLRGLADFDAALCLCTTIRARVLNINAILPVALQVLINCGCNPPPGFQCPA